jgi:hypothetical protein
MVGLQKGLQKLGRNIPKKWPEHCRDMEGLRISLAAGKSGLSISLLNIPKNTLKFEDDCKILEPRNRLYPLYLKSEMEDEVRILRLLAAN